MVINNVVISNNCMWSNNKSNYHVLIFLNLQVYQLGGIFESICFRVDVNPYGVFSYFEVDSLNCLVLISRRFTAKIIVNV